MPLLFHSLSCRTGHSRHRPLELETRLANSVCQTLDPPVIAKAVSIKTNGLDLFRLGPSCQLRADNGGRSSVPGVVDLVTQRLALGTRVAERHTLQIVDDLGVYVLGTTKNAEPRTIARTANPFPQTTLATNPPLKFDRA